MNEDWKGNGEIFKTYAKGFGKRCTESHKGKNFLHDWDEVKDLSSFGAILQPDTIDISFDDEEMSKAFLNVAEEMDWRCLVLENKENCHIHTFWKTPKDWKHKDGSDIKLACGFIADIHHNGTYIPLRVNNADRFPPIYDILPGERYQEIPKELYPIRTQTKLWNMDEGEGRNSSLYGYILSLQNQLSLSPDEIQRMYKKIINPYILKDPLPKDELETILRDDSFQTGEIDLESCFDEHGNISPNKFGKYLIQQNHIVKINGYPHIYKDGVYVASSDDIQRSMFSKCPQIRQNTRREVLEYVRLNAPTIAMSDPELIPFNNGVLDIATGELLDFSPDYVVTNRIPWDYREDAYSEIGDHTLDRVSCGDKSIRALLEECMGSCFYRSNHLAGGMAFIFTGDGANGKSTILDWMRTALGGNDNVSALELAEISQRFSTAGIFGKLANLGDDISDEFLKGSQVSIFKKIVTGNPIKGENKGETPFEFTPFCTLIFSANDIPRINDKSNAVMRRLIIVPFNAVFRKTDPDHNDFLLRDLQQKDCVEYLIRLGVEGLKRVLSDGYTQSEKAEKELKEFEIRNNSVLGYIREEGEDVILNQPTEYAFNNYRGFCEVNNIMPMGKPSFCKQVNRTCGTVIKQRRVDGKVIKIFVKT